MTQPGDGGVKKELSSLCPGTKEEIVASQRAGDAHWGALIGEGEVTARGGHQDVAEIQELPYQVLAQVICNHNVTVSVCHCCRNEAEEHCPQDHQVLQHSQGDAAHYDAVRGHSQVQCVDVQISCNTVRDFPARFTGNMLLYSTHLQLTAMVEDDQVPGLLVTVAPPCQLTMVQHQASGSNELGEIIKKKVSEDWLSSLGRMEQSKAVINDPYSSCQGFAQFSISATNAYDEYKRSDTISCGKVDYEKATKQPVITLVAADPHSSMKETLEAPGEADAEGLPLVQNQLELESRMFLRQEDPGQGYSTDCGSPEKVKEYKSTQVDTAAAIPSSSKLRAEINTTNLMGVLSITCSSSGTEERRTDFTTGPWKVKDLNQEGLSNHQGMLQEVQGDVDDLHSEHCDGVHGREPAEVQDSARVDIMGPSTLGSSPTYAGDEEEEPRVVRQSLMMLNLSHKPVGKQLMGHLKYTQRVKVEDEDDSPDREMEELRQEALVQGISDVELESRMFMKKEDPGKGFSSDCDSPEKVIEIKSNQVDTAAAIPSSNKLRASTENMMGVYSITSASSSTGTGVSRTDFSISHWKATDLNQVTKYQTLVPVSSESHSHQEVLSSHQGVLDELQGAGNDLHPELRDEEHGQEHDEARGELFVEQLLERGVI